MGVIGRLKAPYLHSSPYIGGTQLLFKMYLWEENMND